MEKEAASQKVVARAASFPRTSGKSTKTAIWGKLSRMNHKSLPGSRASDSSVRSSSSPSGLTQSLVDKYENVFYESPAIVALPPPQTLKEFSGRQSKRINRIYRGQAFALQHESLGAEPATNKPREETPMHNQVDRRFDGRWRKYGMKGLAGSSRKTYYRCFAEGCKAKKYVTWSSKEDSPTNEVSNSGNHTCVNLPQKRQRDVYTSMDIQGGTVPRTDNEGELKDTQKSVARHLSAKWVSHLQKSMRLRQKVDPSTMQITQADHCLDHSEELSEISSDESCLEGEMELGTRLEETQELGGDTQEWGSSQVPMSSPSWELPGPSQDWSQAHDITLDQVYASTKRCLQVLIPAKECDVLSFNGPKIASELNPKKEETSGGVFGFGVFSRDTESPSSHNGDVVSPTASLSEELDEDCNISQPISTQAIDHLHKLQTAREVLVAGRVVPTSEESSTGFLEFVFLDGESMSRFLGVGLDHSKVRMTSATSIELIQCEEKEWGLLWAEALDEECTFKVLSITIPEPPSEDQDSETLSPFEFAERFGVGVDRPGLTGTIKYANGGDENPQQAAEFEPLLWAAASFLLNSQGTSRTGRQHTAPDSGRAGTQGQGNFSDGNDLSSVLSIPNFFSLKIGSGGGDNGDGNEDTAGGVRKGNGTAAKADNALLLRVTVHPGRGGMVHAGVSPPKSLAKVSKIFSILTFDFEKQKDFKSISVEILAECPLGQGGANAREKDRFGWYHDHINVSLKCQAEDKSILGSYGLMDQAETVRSYVANSSTNSTGLQVQNQANISASIPWLGGISIGNQTGANRSNGSTDTHYEGFELGSQQVIDGFGSCDKSSMGEARIAYEFSFQTEVPKDVWRQSTLRRWFAQSGICSTLKRTIKGTWEPLDEDEHSPYLFEVSRELVERYKNSSNCLADESRSREFLQEYMVPLFVNHAMTHLGQTGRRNHVINERVKEIPRVLILGCGI